MPRNVAIVLPLFLVVVVAIGLWLSPSDTTMFSGKALTAGLATAVLTGALLDL